MKMRWIRAMADLIERDALLQDMTHRGGLGIGDWHIFDVINEQPAVNRWIPCSERLPEIDKDVIVFYPHWRDNPIQVAHLNYDKLTFELSDGEYNIATHAVTHWMPLPEYPLGGARNG